MRQQVINPHTGGTYRHKSLLTTELLFHDVPGLNRYFTVDTTRTDDFTKFISDGQKVTFARDVVPTIGAQYFEVFALTAERLAGAKDDVIILHPGPMNRGVEISSEVADGPYSVILEQVSNGVAVRMAVLYLLALRQADGE